MKKKTKAQLEKIMAAGYAARNELDERKDAEAEKRNAALIGKCHRYRNSYGGDSEHWWIYRRVIGVNGIWLKTFQFQTDIRGQVRIDTKEESHSDMTEWKEITDAEFSYAFNEMMRKVSAAYKQS